MRITTWAGAVWFCLMITLGCMAVAIPTKWLLMPPDVFAYDWKITGLLVLVLAIPISLWGGLQIREKTAMMDELRDLVNNDALTRLLSRRRFYQLVERDLGPGTLLLGDLDRFKQINDGFGHATGDQVLIGVATVLQGTVGDRGIVGRLGGEELAIWLPDLAGADADAMAERLRAAVATARLAEGRAGRVTISFGLAERMRDEEIDSLLGRADQALYAAKGAGRNRIWRHGTPPAVAARPKPDCLLRGTG